MSVKEYTLELEGNMRARMGKFIFGLSNDLVIEYKGAMLNRDIDFSKQSVHMQQVEDQKKKVAEIRGKDRQSKTAKPVDQNYSQQQGGNWGTGGRRKKIRPGHIQRDYPTARVNVGGPKSQANSSAPPPPPKGSPSTTESDRNRLYALTNRKKEESSPKVKYLSTDSLSVVNEFTNVLPDDLPGIPPDREIFSFIAGAN
ncbi:uncharacterized protein LOC124887836 [Capsicum annuum]|uniref:uncharacterized protein LOC124887836 n=1 Tax=Capsicum annuum TaxID=4072 RepID=UPI001FB0E814|nr:uncharacterized protein LOC124887836 [Capsicum annuum]